MVSLLPTFMLFLFVFMVYAIFKQVVKLDLKVNYQ